MRFPVLFLCAGLLFSCGFLQDKDAQTVTKAKELFAKSKSQDAIILLENAIKTNAPSPKSLAFLAELRINRKQIEQAKVLIGQMPSRTRGEKAFLEYMKSRLYFETKEFDLALASAALASESEPKSGIYAAFRAYLAVNLQNDEGTPAKKLAQDAVKMDRKNPIALLALGISDLFEGQNESGIKNLKEAEKLSAGNYLALRSCGLLYSALEKAPEAEKMFDQLIALDDYNPASYAMRGNHFLSASVPAKALADFGKALELDPNNKDYQLSIGNAYYSALDFEKAQEIFLTVLEQWPDEPAALYNMAYIRYYLNDLLEARSYADRCERMGIKLEQAFLDNLSNDEKMTQELLDGMRAAN